MIGTVSIVSNLAVSIFSSSLVVVSVAGPLAFIATF